MQSIFFSVLTPAKSDFLLTVNLLSMLGANSNWKHFGLGIN